MINNTICTPVSLPEPNPQAGEAGQPPRRRGAPRGNKNARTHGAYSRQLTRKIHDLVARCPNLPESNREVYVAFIRAQFVMTRAPHNEAVVNQTMNALVKTVCNRWFLDPYDQDALKDALQRVASDLSAMELEATVT